MKRILLFLTLCFSIIETIAQNYSVDIIDFGDYKEYKVEKDFSTNIQRLKVNLSVCDFEQSDLCCITFTQIKPASFIEGLEEKLIAGADRDENSITKKSYATIFFSDGTSCKVGCMYSMTNPILKMIAGFRDLEIMFQIGATYRGNVTVGDKMKRTNITGISMFGKRVNFVNFSSVKAISAITKKIEDDSSKNEYCDKCYGKGRYTCPCNGVATFGNTDYHKCSNCGQNHVVGESHSCRCNYCFGTGHKI